MTKQEVNPIFLILAIVVVIGVILFVFYRAASPAAPPAGSYTPGVPPWMEKNRPQTQTGVHQAPSPPQGR